MNPDQPDKGWVLHGLLLSTWVLYSKLSLKRDVDRLQWLLVTESQHRGT